MRRIAYWLSFLVPKIIREEIILHALVNALPHVGRCSYRKLIYGYLGLRMKSGAYCRLYPILMNINNEYEGDKS